MSKSAKLATLDAALAIVREWGAQGGRIGGKSRMAKLTTEERHALAKKAAAARWRKRSR